MVGGQLTPDSGRVMLDGQDITGLAPRRIWRLGVGRTFQVAQTFVSMTVAENVQMALISRHGRTRAWWPDATGLYRDEALAPARPGRHGRRRRPSRAASSPTATSSASSWPSRWPARPSCC